MPRRLKPIIGRVKRNALPAVCAVWFAASQASFAQNATYPPGYRFAEVPHPMEEANPTRPASPLPFPAAGEPFFDPEFGTIVSRATDPDGINGRHFYSRLDPFNANQTLILLVTDQGDWNVFHTDAAPYNQSSNHVARLDLGEPRWDHVDPALLWGFDEFSIVTVNTVTMERKTVKNFAEDATIGPLIANAPALYITMGDEGEPSMDFRFWCLALLSDDRLDYVPLRLFTWDREKDRVLGVLGVAEDERSIDWAGMSPLGDWVIIGGDPWNGGRLSGLVFSNPQLDRFQRAANGTAHSDTGLDRNGAEVIVMQNSLTDHIDMIPLSWDVRPVESGGGPADGYAGSGITPLIRLFYSTDSPFGFGCGVHISCNHPGYALVSTHIEPGVPERNWLDRSLVLVDLNPSAPRVFYLAKIRNTTQTYWEETHGVISNGGSRVVWASNWGIDPGSARMFLMQIDMPPGWSEWDAPAGDWRLHGK